MPHTHSQPEDTEATSNNSVGRSEVKSQSILRRSKRKKKDNQDFGVFLDRRSLILNTDEVRQYPEAKTLMSKEISPDQTKISPDQAKISPDQAKISPDQTKILTGRVQDINLSHKPPRKVSMVNKWVVKEAWPARTLLHRKVKIVTELNAYFTIKKSNTSYKLS